MTVKPNARLLLSLSTEVLRVQKAALEVEEGRGASLDEVARYLKNVEELAALLRGKVEKGGAW